jgi:hypothetical protein
MWINVNSLRVYNLHSEIRKEFKNVSMPPVLGDSILSAFSIVPVVKTTSPVVDHTKNVVEVAPALVNGAWTQVWEVTEATADEIAERSEQAAAFVRSQRNALLASTDWLVIKAQETGGSISADWAAYRQALRDITAQEGFPHSVAWPTKP